MGVDAMHGEWIRVFISGDPTRASHVEIYMH